MPEETENSTENLAEDPAESEKVKPLDPDFLIFAMPFAIFIDILDWVLDIGTIVSWLLGIPLVIWMIIRTKRIETAKEQFEKLKAAKGVARTGGRNVWRRALLLYLGEAVPIINFLPFWSIGVFSLTGIFPKISLFSPAGEK